MRDKYSQERIDEMHPKVRQAFTDFINEAEKVLNLTLRIVESFRSFARQQQLYNQGRTTPGAIVTWSIPGSSYHNYGLAADIVSLDDKGNPMWSFDFSQLKPFANKYGITWGGDFPSGKKDMDHFENKLGQNWRYDLHLYNTQDFIKGTHFINL